MASNELTALQDRLFASGEKEDVESKTANNQYSIYKTGENVSAIANEENRRGRAPGSVVCVTGNDRIVVGTALMQPSQSRQPLKHHNRQSSHHGRTLDEAYKLPDVPIDDQKQSKVHNSADAATKVGSIITVGATRYACCQLSSTKRTVGSVLLSRVMMTDWTDFPLDSDSLRLGNTPFDEAQTNRIKAKWTTQ